MKRRHEIWRRYSEFETLKHFLGTVYPHIVIPPLPEKAVSCGHHVYVGRYCNIVLSLVPRLLSLWTGKGSGYEATLCSLCMLHYCFEVCSFFCLFQIKGSSGLLNRITFTGEDHDFLLKRQQALEVKFWLAALFPGSLRSCRETEVERREPGHYTFVNTRFFHVIMK